MTRRLQFDDRLLNPYAVEDLAAGHPALHAALRVWFAAFGDFDTDSLGKLVGARSPAEVDRWKAKGESALASIPPMVATLDAVIRELDAARSDPTAGVDPARLDALRQSAEVNRTALLEQAPALVAAALGASAGYDAAQAAAAEAVERAVTRIEALRVRSEDPSLPYRELQPLVTQLREAWQALDRDLAPLSRADQRAVRAGGDARLRPAARALCRNLFRCKQRDRAASAWPMPVVPAPGPSVAEQFAALLGRGDQAAAHALLAPWLAATWTVDRLAEAVEESAGAVASERDLTAPPPIAGWYVGDNPMKYPDVRSNPTLAAAVPAEVTADNYRGWFVVELTTDEEDAYLTDVDLVVRAYLAVTATPEGDRVGHLAFAD